MKLRSHTALKRRRAEDESKERSVDDGRDKSAHHNDASANEGPVLHRLTGKRFAEMASELEAAVEGLPENMQFVLDLMARMGQAPITQKHMMFNSDATVMISRVLRDLAQNKMAKTRETFFVRCSWRRPLLQV